VKTVARRRSLLAAVVALAATAALAGPALAGQTKVEICHFDEDAGEYVLLRVAQAASDAHFANHDDIQPNSDGECADERPPALLARAYQTMPDGSERTISQLVDTDESGTPTPGDVVEVAGVLRDFDPDTDLIPVGIDRHVIPEDVSVDQLGPTIIFLSWIRDNGSGGDEYVAFRFLGSGTADVYYEVSNPDWPNVSAVATGSNDFFGVPASGDYLQVSPITPSKPQVERPFEIRGDADSASTDNAYLDVDIYEIVG